MDILGFIYGKLCKWRQIVVTSPKIIHRLVIAVYYWFVYRRKKCIYIKFPQSCRLGNQLFITAFGESLRRKTGLPVVYYTKYKDYYLHEIDSWIFKRFKVLTFDVPMDSVIEEKSLLNQNAYNLICFALKSGNVMISGFFEDIRFFEFDNPQMIHPRPVWITRKIEQLYGDLTQCASIHVRRGDFVRLKISLGIDYYIKAMSFFPADTTFIVLSDDLEWCKKEFDCCNRTVIYADRNTSHNRIYLDLFLPSMCKVGNILSASSFSWWGSALNDNPDALRVMPRPWWHDMNKHLYWKDAIIIDTQGMD